MSFEFWRAFDETLLAGAVSALHASCEARGRGDGIADKMTVLAKRRKNVALVPAEVIDGRTGLYVDAHLVLRTSHLDLRAGFGIEKRAPVIRDGLKTALSPLFRDRRMILRAHFLPVAAQTVFTEPRVNETEGGIDRRVKIRRADGFGVGVRQR